MLRFVCAESILSEQVQPVNIFYQPVQSLSGVKDSLIASIEYNISTLESRIVSYSPLAASDTLNEPETSHPLVRISTDSPGGSTTITSLSTFNPAHTQILTLHLRDDDLVFAASFSADPLTPPSTSEDPKIKLKVVILRPQPGPTPKFNERKPVMIGSDGKEIPQAAEVEKSFFQKYWWVFALVAVLALAGGGDK